MNLSYRIGGIFLLFGSNLQFLRRQKGITQEQLALQMNVSRQTVSKWESGQTPELGKLLELSDLFSCTLDDLLRQDLTAGSSFIRFLRVKGFSMARYVMISPNAEADLYRYLHTWAEENRIPNAPYLSWAFPYVSSDLKKRFGLTGFAAACILPKDFSPLCSGPEITCQDDCSYAVLSIPEPAGRNPHQISRAIQTILSCLQQAGIPKAAREDCLPCFELRYKKDGIPWADIFLQCQASSAEEQFTFY